MEDNDLSDELLTQMFDAYDAGLEAYNQCDANQNNQLLSQEPVENNASQTEGPGPEHLEVLHKCFGHKEFRKLQWEIISAVIKEKRDVCAIMSTGYGKSLCFQFPSTFLGGITLVISPLISLMQDQILSLTVSNIPACLLGSAQTEKSKVVEEIFQDAYSLVYLTPEFCSGTNGKELLQRMSMESNVVLIAIDEAHCISSWGHDFRVHYRKLGELKTIFPNVPMIAVTATATPQVRADICHNLNLVNPLKVTSGFDRPNLYFEVHAKRDLCGDLKRHMVQNSVGGWMFPGPTIIYVIRRKDTEEVSKLLNAMHIPTVQYHAGLSLTVRKQAHERFVKDEVQVVVATIAFGMGIDKPDIRYIIHYGCAKSLEGYYQEVGRAGRDGLPSKCVTYWSDLDFQIYRSMPEKNKCTLEEKLSIIRNYLRTSVCRRRFILNYFDNTKELSIRPLVKCCDNCTRKLVDSRTDFEKYEGINAEGKYDFTQNAHLFLSAVEVLSGRYGMGNYILFVRGSTSSKLHEKYYSHPLHGAGRTLPDIWWKGLAEILKDQGLLKARHVQTENRFSYPIVEITTKGRDFLRNVEQHPDTTKLLAEPPIDMLKLLKQKRTNYGIVLPPPSTVGTPSKRAEVIDNALELERRRTVFRRLATARSEIAKELDCMPYMVVSNTALMALSDCKVTTLSELRELKLDGLTDVKIAKFGLKLLEVLHPNGASTSAAGRNPGTQTIQDILVTQSLPNIQRSMSAAVISSMLRSGKGVNQIALERGISRTDVTKHAINGIKMGYPIRMSALGVTEEIRNGIIEAIKKVDIDINNVKLMPIKDLCPPDVTFDHIRVVVAYLQVRNFLDSRSISYEDFEDFNYQDLNILLGDEESDKKLSAMLDMAEEMLEAPAIKKGRMDQNVENETPKVNEIESPEIIEIKSEEWPEFSQESSNERIEEKGKENVQAKVEDVEMMSQEWSEFDPEVLSSILDSPPRQTKNIPEEVTLPIVKEETTTIVKQPQEKKSKKNLPSWLVTRKIV